MKKTIALAAVLSAASALSAEEIKTPQDAIDQLTGPNQTRLTELCIKVQPAFITSRMPGGMASSFMGFKIPGVTRGVESVEGSCTYPQDGVCEAGFVKITSTAPLMCYVPIGL